MAEPRRQTASPFAIFRTLGTTISETFVLNEITVPETVSIASTEECFRLISQLSQAVEIRLPLTMRDRSPGGMAALVQFLITCFRRPYGGTSSYAVGSSAVTLQDCLKLEHGLISVLMADRVRVGTVVHDSPQSYASKGMTDFAEGVGPDRHKTFMYLCADHVSIELGRSVDLYQPTGEVRSIGDYMDLAGRLLTTLVSSRPMPRSDTSDPKTSLGKVLFELFDNTHRWARTDRDGGRLKKSVRGIYARVHPATELDPSPQDSALSPHLAAFVKRTSRSALGSAGLLELSIFDSGPGIAARMRESWEDPLHEELQGYSGGLCETRNVRQESAARSGSSRRDGAPDRIRRVSSSQIWAALTMSRLRGSPL